MDDFRQILESSLTESMLPLIKATKSILGSKLIQNTIRSMSMPKHCINNNLFRRTFHSLRIGKLKNPSSSLSQIHCVKATNILSHPRCITSFCKNTTLNQLDPATNTQIASNLNIPLQSLLLYPHDKKSFTTPSQSQASSESSSDRQHPEQMYQYESYLQHEKEGDAKVIFELIFGEISHKMGGDFNMVFPKDIMWLCGAPGSGKGEMSQWIMWQRGYHAEPIKISSILQGPEIEQLKESGKLVSDRIVLTILLEKLLLPEYRTGIMSII